MRSRVCVQSSSECTPTLSRYQFMWIYLSIGIYTSSKITHHKVQEHDEPLSSSFSYSLSLSQLTIDLTLNLPAFLAFRAQPITFYAKISHWIKKKKMKFCFVWIAWKFYFVFQIKKLPLFWKRYPVIYDIW